MAAATRPRVLEQGDIFFFYRPKIDVDEVRGRGDVQRFYMVLAPERPKKLYRLFVVGAKRLPEVVHGAQPRSRRNWAVNVLTSGDPEALRLELGPASYETATRGERHLAAATPVGEGRYALLRHHDHAELAYVLELPRKPGVAQEEFEIADEGSFIVAVKNPAVVTPGYPSPKDPPDYPEPLQRKFGNRRWIDADDPALLDYENTQIMLLGARGEDVQEEFGVDVHADEGEALGTAEVCRELRVSCDEEHVKPILAGEFPEYEQRAAS